MHRSNQNDCRQTCILRVTNFHLAAKGVRHKESGKKVTRKMTETSEKMTKSDPRRKNDRTHFADLLLLLRPGCRGDFR